MKHQFSTKQELIEERNSLKLRLSRAWPFDISKSQRRSMQADVLKLNSLINERNH